MATKDKRKYVQKYAKNWEADPLLKGMYVAIISYYSLFFGTAPLSSCAEALLDFTRLRARLEFRSPSRF